MLIKATILYDGKNKSENKYIEIKNDRIISVSEISDKKADISGIVTPAFIDAHSHIGMCRHGMPWDEDEANETIDQVSILLDPIDSIYFEDKSFQNAVDAGVLYSCVVPGSGNIFGGKAIIIRNFSSNRKNALIKNYGYKMALGYNPISTQKWKGKRPSTRMGVYQMIEDKFDSIIRKQAKEKLKKEKIIYELNKKYKENKLKKIDFEFQKKTIKKEYDLSFSKEDEALLEMLNGKTIKMHVHKEDDVLYLIKLVKKYNLNVTAEHVADVHSKEIFNELAENNIPIIYGPVGTFASKTELQNLDKNNIKKLIESKAYYGLMTDHPVILSSSLKDCLKYFLRHGMNEEEAVSMITYKNAKILGIENELGSIEKNKIASLIVWNGNPFYLGAKPTHIFAEGKLIRENK